MTIASAATASLFRRKRQKASLHRLRCWGLDRDENGLDRYLAHRVLPIRMRGSINPYRRSVTRYETAMSVVHNRVKAMIMG